ncbi:hypothetical protein Afil01_49830 [Actinorhabdospora filicis]|uniref:Winged helix DNA-binding domain-containing protein n=1 Tax=Actinorhabdospora filicis TaxID=1785913 RepID=A0A9W6SQ45_9ACTN|nr:crosslink repair DNA glycosylase YcaQ family protein [Actinorhabdospora filicis]GLZ80176.1 hypothetical protein Afil01_49830 [Actinorhabdospora filicis]
MITREQVRWYRAAAQGLARDGSFRPVLGVQDTPPGSAVAALTARGAAEPDAMTWTHRGAPHLHPAGDLPGLARALWPHSPADAAARLQSTGAKLAKAGVDVRAAFADVAAAMREAAAEPLTKGELSAAVTAAVPPEYSYDCPGCGTFHVYESLFRHGALPAGLVAVPESPQLTFRRLPDWEGVPEAPEGTGGLIAAFLAATGPGGPAEIAGFLDTRPARAREFWPAGLSEVDLDGRVAWFPGERLDDLRAAARPDYVRLLPPSDAYLLGDRELLLPEAAHRAELWKNLSRRGAVLADGELVGYWTQKAAGRRLRVTIVPFGRLSATVGERLEAEADLLAVARGFTAAVLDV